MSTYATVADFKAWSVMDPMPADADIQKALDRAEIDVDSYLPGPIIEDTGLHVDPATLLTWQVQRLRDATCAQAEYRLELGEEFFQQSSNDEVIQGPDFTISGRRSRFSPVAAQLLRTASLLVMGARAVP